MNSAQTTFAFIETVGRAVHGTVQSDVGFVPRDIYPFCANHPGRDAHWRRGEPGKHPGAQSTFLCDECKADMEANVPVTRGGTPSRPAAGCAGDPS